jgi:hypothetical protein
MYIDGKVRCGTYHTDTRDSTRGQEGSESIWRPALFREQILCPAI